MSGLKQSRIAVFAYAVSVLLRLVGQRLKHGRRLLVVFRAGGLGDIVATQPALAALRAQFPAARIVYCTRPQFMGIRELMPEIDAVLGIYHSDRVAAVVARVFDTRIFKYDDEIAGRRSTRSFVREMAESAGVTLRDDVPRIPAPPSTAPGGFEALVGRKRPAGLVIAVHLGPTEKVREWPASAWSTLIEQLQSRLGATVVDVGVHPHFLHGASRPAEIPGTLRLLAPPTLAQTAALLRECDLFIGIDSGPLHLAAAVGTPAIGLFGPVDPRLRVSAAVTALVASPALTCQYCHHQTPRGHWGTGCPHDVRCMAAIAPQTVFQAAKNHLHSIPNLKETSTS